VHANLPQFERQNVTATVTARQAGPRPAAGFTIVECLVAVILIAVIALIAVPNVAARIQQSQLERVLALVAAELKAARSQAMSEGLDAVVEIQGSPQRMVVKADRNGDASYTGDEERTAVDLEEPDGLAVNAATATGTFRADGTFWCATGQWKIGMTVGATGERYVYVFPGGHVEKSDESL
jgi:prepilin-type N-terminal cleavage/methylation domain-containing protein